MSKNPKKGRLKPPNIWSPDIPKEILLAIQEDITSACVAAGLLPAVEVRGEDIIVCAKHGNYKHNVPPQCMCHFKIPIGTPCNCECTCLQVSTQIQSDRDENFRTFLKERDDISHGLSVQIAEKDKMILALKDKASRHLPAATSTELLISIGGLNSSIALFTDHTGWAIVWLVFAIVCFIKSLVEKP